MNLKWVMGIYAPIQLMKITVNPSAKNSAKCHRICIM